MSTNPNSRKVRPVKARKTKAQRQAAAFLDLHAMIHFLMTEQRCPVLFDGRLAYVRCPGVCREAFKRAIEKRVARNLLHFIEDTRPTSTHKEKCGDGKA